MTARPASAPPSRLRALALALCLMGAGAAPLAPARAQSSLPALGDASSEGLDILGERRLGERIMREVRRDPDYLDDPLLSDYLQPLWSRLLQAARARGEINPDLDRTYGWELFQVRDRSVNAFALPGGFVGVHLGLIAMTASSDELASVLAHELTHVTQRHIARSMENSQRQGMASMAAILLGILVASRSTAVDGAQAVIMGGQAAAMQGQLNFSREMEREADRIGQQVLSEAGFSAWGMAGMFEKLDAGARLNDSNQYPYLRSHPLTIERISEARLRASGAEPGAAPAEVLALHALMQGRARALVDRSEQAWRRLQDSASAAAPAGQPETTRLGQHYAAALASLQLREPERAEAFLRSAQALEGGRLATLPAVAGVLDLLQLEVSALRQGPQALALLQDGGALAARPGRAALLARAQAGLLLRRHGVAGTEGVLRRETQALQTWVIEHRRDVLAWQTLSQLAEAQGQTLRAQRAAAEAAAAQGDVVGAVDRFRAAQQSVQQDPKADYMEVAIVQSRLRELEAEKRRLLAEARGERPD
ncbi:M48 family metalloprotease [Ideonella livida]|uniref:M48 family metalloprotease n=1 Tax=Ideonella livida TaxID=2707176 RepID=UPI001EF1B280|nr:M48 family metalloprotease [Ideonella livida]